MEYINISGLRLDGRRPPEVRRLRTEFGLFPKADGSALLEMGHTKVLAVVHGPREAKFRSATEHDAAVLECDFTIAPFAAPERRKRRGGGGDKRVTEIETALKQCFEAALELKHYPRSVISVHVMVLQSDGGLLPAAINAGILALVDAGVSMRDYVVACSTLHVQKTVVLDPSHAEMTSGGPELTVAILPRSGKVTLTTMEARLPVELFEGMLKASIKGCLQIHDILNTAAIEHATDLLKRRRGGRAAAGGGAGGSGAGEEGFGDEDNEEGEAEEEAAAAGAGGAGSADDGDADLKRAIEASLAQETSKTMVEDER